MPDGTQTLEAEAALAEPQIQGWNYFPSTVYTVERPDFLPMVKEVSDERLKIQKAQRKIDPIYPVIMTDSYFADPRVAKFAEFIGQNSWSILQGQGYAMDNLSVVFTEMWTQEHHKHSLMEQHVHGFGAQIAGFYFIEVPDKSSQVIFHDPRAGKVQSNLMEFNMSNVTNASNAIHFNPKPGLMIFSNAWLPHSFGRHAANKPLKFVHFNLTVQVNQNAVCAVPPPAAEII
jgi:uncharacterized protein (TIGR02466 family)